MIDICIIGGGAAGMTAAICAKEANPPLDVLLLEKKNQLGKKLLATGNGKCNLSNQACDGCGETLDFFGRLGLLTRTDSAGRIYPYTEEARAVQGALAARLQQLDVRVDTSSEVISVEKDGDAFHIRLANRELTAKKVLIAWRRPRPDRPMEALETASASPGGLGHSVERLIPVLTAVDVKEDMERLAGIRAKAAVSLWYADKEIFREAGEIQFTKTGISGICVFNLSRYLLIPAGRGLEDGFDDYGITVDFFPDVELTELEALLERRQASGFDGERLLQYLVRGPVGGKILESSKGDVKLSARLLKAFPLSPKRVRGWDFAQVTKGGVCLDQVDPETCQSRLVNGLYFAGEVLDYDGPCGGYNLQHAWETGMRAGREMAK